MFQKKSVRYILFIFIFYTLIFNELLATIIPVFSYEDELLALFAIPIYIVKKRQSKQKEKVKRRVSTYVVCFLLISLLSSLVYRYQNFIKVALPDLLICSKFWLCIYVGMNYFSGNQLERYAKGILFNVKLIIWLFFIFTISNMIFHIWPIRDYRFGIGSNSLFYGHPTSLVATCSFLAVVLLGLKDYNRKCGLYILMTSFIICSTLRSKGFGDVIIFGIIYYFSYIRKKEVSLKTILPFVPVVIYIGWSQISYYFLSSVDVSARAQLAIKSVEIAKDHFPLGAGLGTYGSYYSAVYYSPVYYKYGLNVIYGLSQDMVSFISDTFWPMIIGQSGFLGTAFYIMAIIMLIKQIKRLKNINRNYYISSLALICYLLVESVAAVAFVHPLSMPLALWLGIMLKEQKNRRRVIL